MASDDEGWLVGQSMAPGVEVIVVCEGDRKAGKPFASEPSSGCHVYADGHDASCCGCCRG